ncbi:MAG: 3-oxoacyl-[acyl-carrier-protein] reductase [Bdellovibrionales bacterium]|nr:3-oxoacyl-[acyl-carrier-protein] reductase [Bdellovibrionales bacterium]
MTDTIDRVVLVTGASRGIGKSIALALSNETSMVYVNYQKSASIAQEVVSEIKANGGQAKAIGFDVSDLNSVKESFEQMAKESKGIDVLVNNAGVSIDGLVLRAKEADWQKVIDVNLKGAFYCAQAALKTMLKRPNGRIVFLSSVVGQMGNAGQAIYAASKAGIHGLTKSIAKEVASRNITVNAVAPGFVRTEMTDNLTEDQKQTLLRHIPLQRYAEPEEIASIVKFLVSTKASYVTGQVIAVNGGMYL